MADLTNNSDLEFTASAGALTGKAKRLNDGTNTATAEEVRDHLDAFSTIPGIIYGTATDLDTDGNPTPDTGTYDPTTLAEGTLLFATTGPSAQDNGTGVTTTYEGVDMRFRVESDAWVWDGGSYRASNSNGNYQRFADGSQVCRGSQAKTVDINNADGNVFGSGTITVTWPAAFAAVPDWLPAASGATRVWAAGSATADTTTQGNLTLVRATTGTGIAVSILFTASGQW